MTVLNRGALEDSPLADLHELASELSIDGYRRLRREALIDAILDRQGGEPAAAPGDAGAGEQAGDVVAEEEAEEQPARRRRSRRGGRARADRSDRTDRADGAEPADRGDHADLADASAADTGAPEAELALAEDAAAEGPSADEPSGRDEEVVEGVVELLPNGSGFLRVNPPDASEADVYISAAQVKRCELVTGDRVAGPRRAPRRSERFASLIRVDTVNGRPASELADGLRFEDLPCAFPSVRIALGSEDPTLKAIEFLTPFGRGSRVTVAGAHRAGKTEALRRIYERLTLQDELQVSLVLAGVRPEEISEASRYERPPAAAVSFASSPDAQASAVELAVDQARRIAARGAHAVVLIDTLDGIAPHLARRITAAARNIVDGGSLTIIATATAPFGVETTVIALDAALTAQGRMPALDFALSGTLRPELLVGEAAAEAITRTRAEALS